MTRLTDAALRAQERLEAALDVEPEEAEDPAGWHSPMVWTSDIERSPCWWPAQGLLEVITPGRRMYYHRDELEDVRFL